MFYSCFQTSLEELSSNWCKNSDGGLSPNLKQIALGSSKHLPKTLCVQGIIFGTGKGHQLEDKVLHQNFYQGWSALIVNSDVCWRVVTFLFALFLWSLVSYFAWKCPMAAPPWYLGTAPYWASDYRLKLASSLSEGDQRRQEYSGSGRGGGLEVRAPLKCWHPLRGHGAQGSPRL